ncbi:MAG: hypothetical protein KC776_19785 [Myxococcales bacterium]|nr:hypothetical protein [Myxococcales bacterium]MCB9581344.1 hypothetical protein [Polyangiaceae bacterium]
MKQRIEKLANAMSVFGAAHHKWQLAEPWSEDEVRKFEKSHGGALPEQYRRWLLEVGASGAGPGNGLFTPGMLDNGGGPKPWKRRFGPLGKDFPYTAEVDKHAGKLPGAMPVSDLGCGILALLVTAGAERGKIWVDDRANRCGLRPEDGLTFDAWIEAWLTAAEREAKDPWKPAKDHENVPDVVIPASEVVEASALQAFVDQVHAALADGDVVSFGKLGEIRKRGPSLSFQQGKALHDAMDGKALPSGGGTLADVFRALFDQPRWHALEIPGLLRTWVGEDKHVEMRDYLGRTQLVGRAGPFLVVQSVRPSNTR